MVSLALALSLSACGSKAVTDTNETAPAETPEQEETERTMEAVQTSSVVDNQDDLSEIFDCAYSAGDVYYDRTSDEVMELEHFTLVDEYDRYKSFNNVSDEESLSDDDLISTYDSWRKEAHPEAYESLFQAVDIMKYATANVNVRSQPNTTSTIVETRTVGDEVTVSGIGLEGTEVEGWYQVALQTDATYTTLGYISADYLSDTAPTVSTDTTNSSRKAAGTNTSSNGTTSSQNSNSGSTQEDPNDPYVSYGTGGFNMAGAYLDELSPEEREEAMQRAEEHAKTAGILGPGYYLHD